MVTAGQLVTCDWAAFVERAAALATEPELRARMAAAARARMEGQTLQMVARRYAEFFQHCAREAAARGTPSPDRFRPLIDLEAVLRVQGARPLPASLRLRPGNLSAAELVTARLPAAEAGRLNQALAARRAGPSPPVTSPPGCRRPPDPTRCHLARRWPARACCSPG